MDTANAIFVINPDAEPISAASSAIDGADAHQAGEPYFDVFVAMRKRAEQRRLDTQLENLVSDRASAFAALTPREQAAIAWVEAVISSGKLQSSDGAYLALRKHFDAAAIARLTALAGTASVRARLGTARRG